MAPRGIVDRVVKAALWRAERAVERFVAPAERARFDPERGERVAHDPRALDAAYYHEALVGGASVVAQGYPLPPAREEGPEKPPTSPIGDLPIAVWASWNVQTARSVLGEHAVGMFGRSGLLVESMLGDDRVQTAFNGYVKNITKCEPNFVPADAAGGEEVAAELADLWEDMLPEEEVEQFFQWARFEGWALANVCWEPWQNQNRWLPRLKTWHPLYVYYRIDIRRYVAITTEGAIEIDPDDPRWFLFTPYGEYRGWLRGAVRAVATPWLVRQFALRDAARFGEVHGLPIRKAKVPAQAPAEDKARFFASIRNLGAESVMLLPVQAGPDAAIWDAELLEAKDTSWEVFPAIRDMCDTAITLAIRGTNLTTAVGTGNSGNKAAAETHQDEDADLAVSERRKFMRAVRTRLLRHYCIYNHGSTAVVPKKARLVDPDGEDVSSELDVMSKAAKTIVEVRAAGHAFDEREVLERAGVPLSEEGEPNRRVVFDPKDAKAAVSVDEARAGQNLPPWPDAAYGGKTLAEAEAEAKPEPAPAPGGAFGGGAKAGDEPASPVEDLLQEPPG